MKGASDDERALRDVVDLGPHLIELLECQFPEIGRDQIEAAFFEVVTEWHEGSDGSKDARDVGYFHMLTRRRVIDLDCSERSRHDREQAWGQDLSPDPLATQVPVDQSIAIAERFEALGAELPDQIAALLKLDERGVFRLWLEGHRRAEVFARALGITESTPIAETRKQVARVKDRLGKKLQRDPEIRRLAEPLRAAWEDACEVGARP